MRRILALLMAFACLTVSGCAAPAEEAGGTRLIALNVGKGDCLLLLVNGAAYLIDSGYDYTANLLLEALRQLEIDHLNGVFLSHCDRDHYGGLMALAQSEVAVDAWYAAAIYYDVTPGQHPAELAAAERGQQVRYLNAGDTLRLPGETEIRVVGPLTVNTENENNNSLVFYAETADGSLLFTGDMKLEEEYALLEAGAFTAADLLKVPFHGDNTASSQSFVETVCPEAALICTSAAQEPDTPASSILKRYGKAGAEVYVTQDYRIGLELTLTSGQVSAREIAWELPDYTGAVTADIDSAEDLLTLRSRMDADLPLAGWIVYSTRGSELIALPEDAVLPAGGTYTLGTKATSAEVDLRLDIKRIWHKSKLDQALILDGSGLVAAITDNGKPE